MLRWCPERCQHEVPWVVEQHVLRFVRCALQSGTKMDTVIGAVPKTTLVQTLDKYVD